LKDRRLTSRYVNSPSLGLLIVSSSRASQSDFVERHLAKWSAQANMVKITRAAIYEVKPFFWEYVATLIPLPEDK
jgi:hypothetical protein